MSTQTIPTDATIRPLRWCPAEGGPVGNHEPHEYRCPEDGPDGPIFLCPGGDYSKTEVREIVEDGERTLDGFTQPAEPQN